MSQHLAEVVRANIAAASRSFETIVTDYGALQTKWATTQAALEAAWRETDEAKRARDIAVNIGKKRLVELDNARKELFDVREQLKAVEAKLAAQDEQRLTLIEDCNRYERLASSVIKEREELRERLEASQQHCAQVMNEAALDQRRWKERVAGEPASDLKVMKVRAFVARLAQLDVSDFAPGIIRQLEELREEARRLVNVEPQAAEILWPLSWPVYAYEAAQAALAKFMADFAGNDLARTERQQKFAAGYIAAMEDRRTA